MGVRFENNTPQILAALGEQKRAALEAIGLKAEGYAKKLAPVDTGNLRNSITHATDKDSAYIGTNVEYAPYQEYGFIDVGGNKHPPKHFIKSAASEHSDEYRAIAKRYLKDE